MPEPEPVEPPVPEITLEEWIAASQSCCAGPPDDEDEPTPPRPEPERPTP